MRGRTRLNTCMRRVKHTSSFCYGFTHLRSMCTPAHVPAVRAPITSSRPHGKPKVQLPTRYRLGTCIVHVPVFSLATGRPRVRVGREAALRERGRVVSRGMLRWKSWCFLQYEVGVTKLGSVNACAHGGGWPKIRHHCVWGMLTRVSTLFQRNWPEYAMIWNGRCIVIGGVDTRAFGGGRPQRPHSRVRRLLGLV